MTRPTVPALALLPLRLFFGATFLYAGLDKLLDPSFFDPAAPTSINAQLVAFARSSPLGDLITASLPLAGLIGLTIAIAEIGVGIGAITGLAFRVAAGGGAALSLLFFLTASWKTHPYYLGADLPYAVGWIALAIAGHGDVLVPAAIRDSFRAPAASLVRPAREEPTSPERRVLLQTGLLAGIAAVAASFALPLRALGIFTEAPPSTSPTPVPGGTTGTGPVPSRTPAPGPSSARSGPVIARVRDVQAGGGSASFTVPFDAPSPLPAGDPGIIIALADGSFVAFDAVCTHAGCTVGWDAQDGVILCPCHDAAFDPAHAGAVLDGPARVPLTSLPIAVDETAGTISLAG